MNNKRINNGSIIFMLLFLISTITIAMISMLQSNSYFLALAREREEYEKNYQITESLLRFGAKYYRNQETIRIDKLPGKVIAEFYGVISIIKKKSKKIMKVDLNCKETTIISLKKVLQT